MGYWSTPEWIGQNMSTTEALIYSVIYNASQERAYCDLSTSKMADIVNKSVITVKRTLKKLEEEKAIERVGYNQYKNVKYIPLLNENNIVSWARGKVSKYQNDTMQGVKVSKYQSIKMIPPSYQNDTMQSIKMIPYNNKSLINDINKAIERSSIKDTTKKADAFSAEFGGAGRMIYKWYDEESYKKIDGWWKHYIFFEDDEELNDLFIKFLDKIAEENNNFINGCRFWYDAINLARYACKYSDEYLIDLSDEEYDKLPDEDKYAHDVTDELKKLLREFAYNGARKELFEFIDLC